MPIWVSKSPIPGLEEKREPAVCHVCLRKPLLPGDGRAKTAGSMTGAFAPFLWVNLKKTGQKPALGRRNWLNSGLLLRPLPSCLLIWAFFRGSLIMSIEDHWELLLTVSPRHVPVYETH